MAFKFPNLGQNNSDKTKKFIHGFQIPKKKGLNNTKQNNKIQSSVPKISKK